MARLESGVCERVLRVVDLGIVGAQNGRGNIVQKFEAMTRRSAEVPHHFARIVPSLLVANRLPHVVQHSGYFILFLEWEKKGFDTTFQDFD